MDTFTYVCNLSILENVMLRSFVTWLYSEIHESMLIKMIKNQNVTWYEKGNF